MSVQTGGQVFLLPDLGEGLVEAELVNWLVAVGDTVHIDQPIAEVETAKSVVEVPSPYEGVVAVLHGAAGDTLEVGKPLITVAHESGSSAASSDADSPAAGSGSGNVLIGYGTSLAGGPGRSRAPLHQTTPSQAPASQAPMAELAPARSVPLVVSPLVRKLAQDNGLVLADIQGSGKDGLILRSDVADAARAAAKTELAAAPSQAVPSQAVHSQAVREAGNGAVVGAGVVHQRTGLAVTAVTPLTGVKKAAATALVRSRREIPDATVWVDVDATALLELRRELKSKGGAPGLVAFVARFVAAGLSRFPELGMALENHNGQDELVRFDGINLGFATQTPRGLMVPVLRNVQGRSARELDGEIRALTDRAVEGHASPAELAGGTFTINNYGMLGVDGSAAIINWPEAAMLGLGRIMERPWVVEGQLCVRSMTELTLAFDHRVCDGAVAAGFLRFVADAMENPTGVLADL